MKINKAIFGIVIFLIIGTLFVRFQPMVNSNNKTKASYGMGVDAFPDVADVKVLEEEKARLITIESFHATKLNNNRDLYIYLPPSYYQDLSKKYPVLYVQDGKGVFYLSDWSKESLSMHVKADQLISKGSIEELIIIGISNMGDQRDSEYAHWDAVDRGISIKGKGTLYEDFIINDVKPLVETSFRVLTGRENTAIMGASLGGFVSFNIGMRHPEIFSKIAMQSLHFGWGEEQLLAKITEGEYKDKKNIRLWMDMGSTESEFMNAMRKVVKSLFAQGYKSFDELAVFEVPKGKHSEGSWAERVEDVLIYFYGNTGKPLELQMITEDKVSMSKQAVGPTQNINPMVTYDSGMRITDLTGDYVIDDEGIVEIGDFGIINPKKEGMVNVTYKTTSGLSGTVIIEVTK